MPVTTIDPVTALVLIDFQYGISALAAEDLIRPPAKVAGRLAAGVRAHRLPVILVRTAFAADWGDAPRNRVSDRPKVGRQPERSTEILDAVDRQATDILVTKHQPGAFHGTDLELQLRRRGVTGIVLGGLFTSYAIESAGRTAYDLGFNVTFAVDAMADIDPLAHAHSIEVIFPRLGEVGDASAILARLGVPVAA